MIFFVCSVVFSVSSVTVFFANLSLRVAKVLQRRFSKFHKFPKALNLQGFSGTCSLVGIIPTLFRGSSLAYLYPKYYLKLRFLH